MKHLMRIVGVCLGIAWMGLHAARGEEYGVLLTFGLKDAAPADHSGSVAVAAGELIGLEGWRFSEKDALTGPASWTARTRGTGGGPKAAGPKTMPVGVLLGIRGNGGTRVTVTLPEGNANVVLADLAPGVPVPLEGVDATAERTARPVGLSRSADNEDYPAVCAGPDGTVWVVWQAYRNGADRLLFASLRNGVPSEPAPVPKAAGDLYKSACAWSGGKLRVVWSAFADGNWDLFSASYGGIAWSPPERLTDAPGTDAEPALAGSGDSAYLVWQATRGAHSDILLRELRGDVWGPEEVVTDVAGNDWMPAVAVSSDGSVSVAWDTYRNGDYDVYLRRRVNGVFEPEIPVAAGEDFEAYAAVACDGVGRTWVAWEEGTPDWGKDQGAVVPNPKPGTGLYRGRRVRVRVLEAGRLFEPAEQPESIVPAGGNKRFHEKPRLAADAAGNVWLTLRWSMATVSYQARKGHYRYNKAWEAYVTSYRGGGWTPPVYLPGSIGRLDSYAPAAGLPAGGLACAWFTDGRTVDDIRMPVLGRVAAAVLPPVGTTEAGTPALVPVDMPAPTVGPAATSEAADTRRIREYRTTIAGVENRILRGDTHRHTEVSWDGSGDGSMVDVWRYGIDAAALDFLEITDHNQRTGVDLEYVWWRTQKLTDVYHNPPHFIGLFGYERSLSFPNGHRNVINAVRGFPSFPITQADTGKGPAEDDTRQLYANERPNDSVIISHTSGTNMGTDWRDNDPYLEPVVEIYQGARTSYEYEGAPKSATPGDGHARNSGYRPEGFVWRAWEKGLRLGIIASSDHGSTHISYASVYAPEPTRKAVVDALRKRHTFGATDNVILDVRSGDRFMGEEWSSATPPELTINVVGTAELTEIALVKDLRFVYVSDPEGSAVRDLRWKDADFGPGTHLYYIRVQQEDGQMAWSSPVWITRE